MDPSDEQLGGNIVPKEGQLAAVWFKGDEGEVAHLRIR